MVWVVKKNHQNGIKPANCINSQRIARNNFSHWMPDKILIRSCSTDVMDAGPDIATNTCIRITLQCQK